MGGMQCLYQSQHIPIDNITKLRIVAFGQQISARLLGSVMGYGGNGVGRAVGACPNYIRVAEPLYNIPRLDCANVYIPANVPMVLVVVDGKHFMPGLLKCSADTPLSCE